MAGAPIIIVGAGQAGLQAAESLRAEGVADEIILIGDENHLPYQRPPLSKQYLVGETDESRLTLRSAETIAGAGVTLLTGTRVAALDRAARRVTLADGRAFTYSGVVLATGARPRPLPVPGAELAGVMQLRTLDDARALSRALSAASDVAIIGGGFIGLETAATARKFGKRVTVFETLPRLMARAVAPPTSDFFAALHRSHGVDLRFGARVAALQGRNGAVGAVVTDDGRAHAADLVVVGIGVIPNDELARAAGLECDRGVVVDAHARTSDARIVAAGDCVARRVPGASELVRLESVQNAIELAKSGAAWLAGHERPFVAAPWFWSDQYDVKLQMAGLSAGHDLIVTRGAPESGAFSIFYFRDGRMIAADSINKPADHVAARRLLDKGATPTPDQAADPAFALMSILK